MSWTLSQRLAVLLACLLLLTSVLAAEPSSSGVSKVPLDIPKNFVNVNLLRTIDLSSAVVREFTTIVVQNVAKEPQSEYFLPVSQKADNHLAFIEASDKKSGAKLKVEQATFDLDSLAQFYKVVLSEPLKPEEKVTIILKLVFTHIVTPFPEKIPQVAKQFLAYNGNIFVSSMYDSEKQKTIVKLPTSTVITYTDNQGTVSKSGNILNYGPFPNVSANSHIELYIHYENTKPILTFSSVKRELEVSHWGENLAVEEHFVLKHDGARLKGQFSRLEFQQSVYAHPQTNVLKSLVFTLPTGARDPYYRDEVGNVSTSNFRTNARKSTLELRPRYPLFGGWNYTWYHGYNVPLQNFLKTKGEKYILNVPFLETIKNATVDKAIVKVVLPEGAINVKVFLPFTVDAETHTKHFTYLDTTGRYAVVLQKHNIVDEHVQNFQIEYEYPSFELYRKPLSASAAFLSLFVISAIVSKLEFKIGGKN